MLKTARTDVKMEVRPTMTMFKAQAQIIAALETSKNTGPIARAHSERRERAAYGGGGERLQKASQV